MTRRRWGIVSSQGAWCGSGCRGLHLSPLLTWTLQIQAVGRRACQAKASPPGGPPSPCFRSRRGSQTRSEVSICLVVQTDQHPQQIIVIFRKQPDGLVPAARNVSTSQVLRRSPTRQQITTNNSRSHGSGRAPPKNANTCITSSRGVARQGGRGGRGASTESSKEPQTQRERHAVSVRTTCVMPTT